MAMPPHHASGSWTGWASQGPVVKLASGRLRARVYPALGARIGRLCRCDATGTFDYLVPLDASRFDLARWQRAGCFTMLPYTNKLPANTLAWGDEVIRVAPSSAPALLHGWGLREPWFVTDMSETHCTMSYAAVATETWPWAYQAELHVDLDPEGIDFSLSVINCSAQPMPAGLGFHPYFLLSGDAQATIEASARWQASAASDGLPAVREPLDGPLRLHLQHGALPRDTLTWFCETHGAEAVIDHPDSGRRITLTSHQSRYLVVHHRAGERFLCIEPSSHLAGRLDPRVDAALPREPVRLHMRLQLE